MAGEDAEKLRQVDYPEIADEWVIKAWRLWAGGLKNWSAIGREVGHDRDTVKKRVRQYEKALAALYDDPDSDPRIELLEGLAQDLQAQLNIALSADRVYYDGDGKRVSETDWRTRSQARKEVTNVRKDAAGYRGVVEVKGVELKGDPENPVVTKHVIEPAAAAETLAILDRVGARGPDGGDPGGDPETDEVHPAQADPEAGSGPLPEPLP